MWRGSRHDELAAVRLALSNRLVWAAAVIIVALLAVVGLAAAAGSQNRGTLLRQLRRPAILPAASVGPGRVERRLNVGGQAIVVRLTPNRAGQRDRLTAVLADDGLPMNGARVTVSFSMPAMNMWAGLRTQLTADGNGRYSAGEPVLGMPGVWQLRLEAIPVAGRPVSVVVNDRMNP